MLHLLRSVTVLIAVLTAMTLVILPSSPVSAEDAWTYVGGSAKPAPSYRGSECSFAVSFDEGRSKLTASAVSVLKEAARESNSNGTSRIVVSRVDNQKRFGSLFRFIQDQNKSIKDELSLSTKLMVSFEEEFVNDLQISSWYYLIDVCDADLRAARSKRILSKDDSRLIRYDVGLVRLYLPLRYQPVWWANVPFAPLPFDLKFETTWPDLLDSTDPKVAVCKRPYPPAEQQCDHVISVEASVPIGFRAAGDPPPISEMVFSGFHLFGGRLYYPKRWQHYSQIDVDFGVVDGAHTDLSCGTNWGDAPVTPSRRWPRAKDILNAISSGTRKCRLRMFLDDLPLRLIVTMKGTEAAHWREIQEPVRTFISAMAVKLTQTPEPANAPDKGARP